MGRRRYKRKSDFNELFDLAGVVWQIGAVVSGGFLLVRSKVKTTAF